MNAATTALLLGQGTLAQTLAGQARDAALGELHSQRPGAAEGYYQLATLGETALLLGDEREAERWYREAAAMGQARLGDLSSTRRQARLIAQATGRWADLVETLLPIPRVVVFTGHMVDRPDRPTPRFPPGAEPAVADAIASRLRRLNAGFGYASAASGSDILFLEAIHAIPGKTVVVLPYAIEEFAQDNVSFPAGDWPSRFERVLAQAGRDVKVATARRFAAGGALFEYANSLLLGLAALQSGALDTDLL